MKAKIIFYGWGGSFVGLLAGLGTIERFMETGEGYWMAGLLLVSVFFLFSHLAGRKCNRKALDEECRRFEKFMDKLLNTTKH